MPVSTVAAILFAALLSFALPVILIIYARKKYGAKLLPMLLGAVFFVVFALVLETQLHYIVLQFDANGQSLLLARSPWLYVVYGIFAAGVFEETARLIAFSLLKKRYKEQFSSPGVPLSYAAGHGGIEAILVTGLTMISNLVFLAMASSNAANPLLSDPALQAQLDVLLSTKASTFLLSGLERVMAICAHTSLSFLIWTGVKQKKALLFYPLAIVLHALMNTPAAMFQAGILTNFVLVELLTGVLVAGIVLLAFVLCKRSSSKHFNSPREENGL